MNGIVWDSEFQQRTYNVSQLDGFMSLDAENAVLRLYDYELNESRTTVVLFLGPNAAKNAERWNSFVDEITRTNTSEDDDDDYGEDANYNCDTEAMLIQCFTKG